MFDDVIHNIPDTQIQPSTVHGHGLYATRAFADGEQLATLSGQKVPWDRYKRAQGFSGEWNATAGDILVVRPFRTRYYYINHSRTPNLKVLEDPLRIITLRAIAPGEELLLDYRAEPLPAEYMAMHGDSYL
ncbi:MAG: SET domain-containing protein [Myxococcota bacterium]